MFNLEQRIPWSCSQHKLPWRCTPEWSSDIRMAKKKKKKYLLSCCLKMPGGGLKAACENAKHHGFVLWKLQHRFYNPHAEFLQKYDVENFATNSLEAKTLKVLQLHSDEDFLLALLFFSSTLEGGTSFSPFVMNASLLANSFLHGSMKISQHLFVAWSCESAMFQRWPSLQLRHEAQSGDDQQLLVL